MKYLNDKEVASGLMFILVGAMGLLLMAKFEFGTTARPGPGFFPIVLSVLLMVIGTTVAALGMRRNSVPIPHIALRPLLLIPCAVCVFAIFIESFGLVPSVLATTIIASFARPYYGLKQRLLIAACLALFSALLFVAVLNLPISLWSF